jgi:23S rRNA (adenine2503-C2)-methyltransferase
MEMDKKRHQSFIKNNANFFSNGDKSFRGNRFYEWLWVKERTVLRILIFSKETRTMLQTNFVINHIKSTPCNGPKKMVL